jgi:hypothetical protein
MQESAALTTVYLLEQNQKFEQYMRQKVDELESRVAAQQARLSSRAEAEEREMWTALEPFGEFDETTPESEPAAPTTGSMVEVEIDLNTQKDLSEWDEEIPGEPIENPLEPTTVNEPEPLPDYLTLMGGTMPLQSAEMATEEVVTDPSAAQPAIDELDNVTQDEAVEDIPTGAIDPVWLEAETITVADEVVTTADPPPLPAEVHEDSGVPDAVAVTADIGSHTILPAHDGDQDAEHLEEIVPWVESFPFVSSVDDQPDETWAETEADTVELLANQEVGWDEAAQVQPLPLDYTAPEFVTFADEETANAAQGAAVESEPKSDPDAISRPEGSDLSSTTNLATDEAEPATWQRPLSAGKKGEWT